MAINTVDVALLAASIGGQAIGRVKSPEARAMAIATRDADKARMLAEAEDRARRARGYDFRDNCQGATCGACRVCALHAVHWPRARAIRNAMYVCDDAIRRANDKHDEFTLSTAEREDTLIRWFRLAALIGRVYARAAEVGRFPISANDMALNTTRFLRSASWRHFGFKGGRDAATADIEPAEILQGAFIRALENGDSINGVPTYGALFRHIQAERSHLTRMANLARSAFMRAALGHVSTAVESWPEMTDKHSMRLLGTRNYATLEDHRVSLAIAHRDEQMAIADDAATFDARREALAGLDDSREFHVILARVLINGATIEEVADAMGLRAETITAKAMESRAASLRHIDTGIDHAERSLDLHYAAERERSVMVEQTRHAERLREQRVARETVHYAMSRAA